MLDEPVGAPVEVGQRGHQFRLERFDGDQGNQAHERADPEWNEGVVMQMQQVVVEAVLLIPH